VDPHQFPLESMCEWKYAFALTFNNIGNNMFGSKQYPAQFGVVLEEWSSTMCRWPLQFVWIPIKSINTPIVQKDGSLVGTPRDARDPNAMEGSNNDSIFQIIISCRSNRLASH